eukprot:scaffold92995_cov70-Cyclotella_meneghiniana.AAC.2
MVAVDKDEDLEDEEAEELANMVSKGQSMQWVHEGTTQDSNYYAILDSDARGNGETTSRKQPRLKIKNSTRTFE